MANNEHFNIWEAFSGTDSWDQLVHRTETPFTGYFPTHGSHLQRPTALGHDPAFDQNMGNPHSTVARRGQNIYSTNAASKNLYENLHSPGGEDPTMLFDNGAHWSNNATWTETPQFQNTTDLFPQQHLEQVDYLGVHTPSGIAGSSFQSCNEASRADDFLSWESNMNQPHPSYSSNVDSYQSHGLPRLAQTSPWTASSDLSSEWVQATAAPATISPKSLTISKSSVTMSSSGSSQGSELALSTNQSPLMSVNMLETEPTINTIVPRPDYRGTRYVMLNSGPSLPSPIVLPSNDTENSKTKSSRMLLPKTCNATAGHKNQGPASSLPSRNLPRATKKIEPKPATSVYVTDSEMDSDRVSSLPRKNAKDRPIQRRESKDVFLVRSKLAGMSYKDIRREGGFTEAESTLRGRYRTLTKNKAERVRKPEWEDNDIHLLKKAVRKYTRKTPSGSGKLKIPWKQVADYIYEKGGSYHFGNATCRKKYDELMARSPR